MHPALALEITGGNMEGKEVRFGIGGSALAAVATSNGATGSYNSMHDSFQPLGVLVPLVNMLLGEIVYGGLGAGLYSMIFIALVAVFIETGTGRGIQPLFTPRDSICSKLSPSTPAPPPFARQHPRACQSTSLRQTLS